MQNNDENCSTVELIADDVTDEQEPSLTDYRYCYFELIFCFCMSGS